MRQALELAEAPATGEENYQTVDVSDPKHPHIANKPRRKRRLFWWLRGGYGKPRKLDQLDPIHRKFEFRRDFLKKLNVLFYPQGPGSCDHNEVDRTVNIITTLPFFGIAWHTYRERKTCQGKLWGASLAGVGLGSIAFHTTSGDIRPWSRKLDYFSIALSSIAMMRSVVPQSSQKHTALALAATAINPLAVSSVNAAAMEMQYWRRARTRPQLRNHHQMHLATCGLGAVCFAVEDLFPHWPIIHSVWHCLSAVSVATTNYLMADVEAEKGLRDGRSRPARSATPPGDPKLLNASGGSSES